MLTSERKELIQQRLREEGRLVAKSFSQQLGVSEDTIRRDLRELAKDGLLQRVHGGALPASPAIADYSAREEIASAAKIKLGRAAAKLIKPGQIVFLDGGTTNLQLARHLPLDLHATIITHSPSIAVELARHPFVELELIGGRLFKHSIVTMGAASAEAISGIRADMFFMGATGVHAEAGVTTGNRDEAAIKRLIAQRSAETILIATGDKLGAASPYSIIPMAEIATLVTEEGLPDTVLQAIKAAGPSVLQV
ncbi:DeoR/GlpR family DNA-binding transcription regulator [Agrobacterium larrymoorei]|uniref:DeoR/GlpR transcriptional regulator n=1 Tax=Agrobacterium larrymoorei TaxID=160699 RepID=A0A4D7DQJ0_9HYPH|nr:DeoR/GlpR family DNA-binding transcription regulator [Agrobacterium larrymoorei]QCI98931.1 DeoR/GlpR transcriptional regulator [Agrobacterium larrymoorei]QYA08178.1 DeoR/GlpR transcriptional regulator [Agrobacterium larrymoorei]